MIFINQISQPHCFCFMLLLSTSSFSYIFLYLSSTLSFRLLSFVINVVKNWWNCVKILHIQKVQEFFYDILISFFDWNIQSVHNLLMEFATNLSPPPKIKVNWHHLHLLLTNSTIEGVWETILIMQNWTRVMLSPSL